MKIAVYMITKDEAPLLKRAIESAQQADYILVADTGSKDNTYEMLTEMAHKEIFKDGRETNKLRYFSINIMPWRFDHARNAVLAMVPNDVDVCVSLDSDEVLSPNWREEIEKHWKDDTTIMRYMFDWSKGIRFMQAKFHKRSGYHWVSPCHEVLTWYAQGKEVVAESREQLITHLPDDTKPRSSYLPLLHMGHVERPHCPRMALYFGRELFFYKKNKEATSVLNKFLSLPDTDYRERAYAYRILGKMNATRTDFEMSIKIAPEFRDPYIWFAAYLYSEEANYKECINMVEKALTIKERSAHYFVDPSSWDGYPYHLMSWCYWHLGDKKTAQELAHEALVLEPANEHYQKCMEKFIRD